jgi:hypothetical protein
MLFDVPLKKHWSMLPMFIALAEMFTTSNIAPLWPLPDVVSAVNEAH